MNRLTDRAAKLGLNVPPELRDEMRDILAGLARDPKASPRDRRGAALALFQAHRAEAESIRLSIEVEAHESLKSQIAELREMIADAGNGSTGPGFGAAQGDAPGPEAA